MICYGIMAGRLFLSRYGGWIDLEDVRSKEVLLRVFQSQDEAEAARRRWVDVVPDLGDLICVIGWPHAEAA